MLGSTISRIHPRTPAQRRPRVSVVIPTYNEARNLPHVLGLLPRDLHEVIVVDGRSVDDTIEVARALRPDVVVVRQNRIGKGNAMACGFAAVTGDVVVMLDADGSADPGEIERYVDALVAAHAEDTALTDQFSPPGNPIRARVLQAGIEIDEPLLAGESVGAVHGVQPAAEIVHELADGAERLLIEAARLVEPARPATAESTI